MKVRNIINQIVRSKNGPPKVSKATRSRIMLHHTKGPGSPWGLARYAVLDLGWNCHPYGFHVHGSKRLYQTAGLDEVTPHAITKGSHASSPSAYAIAFSGNFDKSPPHPNDVHDVAELCSLLMGLHGWDAPSTLVEAPAWIIAPRVAGHREVPWSSDECDHSTTLPNKTCPGLRFDMDAFRILVAEKFTTAPHGGAAAEALRKVGVEVPESFV